jgi:TetR/AcrR family transcriptional repressor of nem operon
MESKVSKSDRTRQFIIETSSGIFNTKGYAGTSMSDLTEATGLTKGSIYGNFSNKEEVALAVFDFNYGKVNSLVGQKMDGAKTFYDKLMVYVRVYDQYTRGGFPQGGCPILNTAVESDDTNSLLKERAAKAVNRWKKRIIDLLNGGVENGEFKGNFDSTQLALSIIALIEGGVMISRVTNSQASLDKILKTVEGLLNGIRSSL